MKIGIVILNYLAYEDTIECVKSIEKQTYQNYEVVIVDNDSSNDSYEVLKKNFKGKPQVTVLKTEENIGFAKGNNFGIAYLKSKDIYNVLAINGDTIFYQEDYLERLSTLTFSKEVAMIGGQIISRDHHNQNTLPVSLRVKKDLQRNRRTIFLLNIIYKFHLDTILAKLKQTKTGEKVLYPEVPTEETIRILDPSKEMLHGAALFFTENYLRNYQGFYPETFLYYEEEFLALVCRRLGFKQLYTDALSIYHKEDASSDLLMDHNRRKAELFKICIIKKNLLLMEKALESSKDKISKRLSSSN